MRRFRYNNFNYYAESPCTKGWGGAPLAVSPQEIDRLSKFAKEFLSWPLQSPNSSPSHGRPLNLAYSKIPAALQLSGMR
jgi:hypothetical protein